MAISTTRFQEKYKKGKEGKDNRRRRQGRPKPRSPVIAQTIHPPRQTKFSKWKSIPPNQDPTLIPLLNFGSVNFSRSSSIKNIGKHLVELCRWLLQELRDFNKKFLLDIDEYLTSQACICCDHKTLEKVKGYLE
ncbi:unnamed protein product [Cunninghamella blakesleeana]